MCALFSHTLALVYSAPWQYNQQRITFECCNIWTRKIACHSRKIFICRFYIFGEFAKMKSLVQWRRRCARKINSTTLIHVFIACMCASVFCTVWLFELIKFVYHRKTKRLYSVSCAIFSFAVLCVSVFARF